MSSTAFLLDSSDAPNISRPNVTNNENSSTHEYNWGPVYASISSFSLFFNILAVVILSDMLETKITSAKIHLLALAISDICINVNAILVAILQGYYYKSFGTCDDMKFRNLFVPRCHSFQNLFVNTNRGITLYITFARAISVSFKYGRRFLDKSGKTVVWELIAYGVVVCGLVPLFVAWTVYEIMDDAEMWLRFGFVYLLLLLIAMIIATVFIVVKLHKQGKSESSTSLRSNSDVKDEFQLMVVVVATVFCTCHFFALLLYGFGLFGKEAFITVIKPLSPFASLGLFLNNGVNFFIYILVSASFRNAFVQRCKRIICMTHSE